MSYGWSSSSVDYDYNYKDKNKFNVGDIVTLKYGINKHDDSEYEYIPMHMDDMVGRRFTISRVEVDDICSYDLKECKFEYGYDESWLEFYGEEFKLGIEDFMI